MHCRIRPMNDEEGESCLKILDDQNLMLEIPEVRVKTNLQIYILI